MLRWRECLEASLDCLERCELPIPLGCCASLKVAFAVLLDNIYE